MAYGYSSESYLMNTNMTWIKKIKNLCILVRWTKVASALEGFTMNAEILMIDINYKIRKSQTKL